MWQIATPVPVVGQTAEATYLFLHLLCVWRRRSPQAAIARGPRALRLRLRMSLIIHLDHLFHRDLRIDLRGRQASMSEQLLDVAKVRSRVEQMRCECVPQ